MVFEQRVADRGGIAHEHDAAGAAVADQTAAHGDAAVIVVHQHGVPADLIEHAVGQLAVLGALVEHRAAAVDRPVAAQQRLFGVHKGAGRVPEGQPAELQVTDGRLLVASELDQVRQTRGFDDGLVQLQRIRRIEGQHVLRRVVIPLAGRVEFLEHVLDEAVFVVHAHLPIVLPAAFVDDVAVGRLPGDAVMVTAPMGSVHGMDVAADRVAPARGPLRAEGVRRVSVVDRHFRVEIWVTGHRLTLAVDEQLIDREAGRRVRLVDPVAMRL